MASIVSGHDEGGPRDFLEGKPVHCGTMLQWFDAENKKWDWCRYEKSPRLRGGLERTAGLVREDWRSTLDHDPAVKNAGVCKFLARCKMSAATFGSSRGTMKRPRGKPPP